MCLHLCFFCVLLASLDKDKQLDGDTKMSFESFMQAQIQAIIADGYEDRPEEWIALYAEEFRKTHLVDSEE